MVSARYPFSNLSVTRSHRCDSSPLGIALVDNLVRHGRRVCDTRCSKLSGVRRTSESQLAAHLGHHAGYGRCDRWSQTLRAASWWALPRSDCWCLQAYVVARPTQAGNHRRRATASRLVAHQALRRSDITSIRITEFRRTGRKVRLLEIDTVDDRLLVFTRWDLGTDPLRRARRADRRRYAPGAGSAAQT